MDSRSSPLLVTLGLGASPQGQKLVGDRHVGIHASSDNWRTCFEINLKSFQCFVSFRPWASVHSPSLTHSRGTLFLQPSVTLLTAHVSENFSKHTSLIHYLSFFTLSPFCNTCLDMYVRQAIELRVLL